MQTLTPQQWEQMARLYVRDQLTEAGIEQVEQRMDADPGFKKQVVLELAIRDQLEEEADLLRRQRIQAETERLHAHRLEQEAEQKLQAVSQNQEKKRIRTESTGKNIDQNSPATKKNDRIIGWGTISVMAGMAACITALFVFRPNLRDAQQPDRPSIASEKKSGSESQNPSVNNQSTNGPAIPSPDSSYAKTPAGSTANPVQTNEKPTQSETPTNPQSELIPETPSGSPNTLIASYSGQYKENLGGQKALAGGGEDAEPENWQIDIFSEANPVNSGTTVGRFELEKNKVRLYLSPDQASIFSSKIKPGEAVLRLEKTRLNRILLYVQNQLFFDLTTNPDGKQIVKKRASIPD